MATKYNKSMRLPPDNYVLRCVEESFGPSKSSGNPMITLEFEIQSPDEIEIAGEKVTIAGTKLTHYVTTQVLNDAEKSEGCRVRAVGDKQKKGIYQLFGLDPEGFNPENPILGFKGKLEHARLTSEENAARKDPTEEQLKKGERGDIIKNPVTKEPVLFYQLKVAEFYGLAAEQVGGTF